MGQMASLLSERQQRKLPSTSEVNPRREGKENCKAVTLRSGKTLEQLVKAKKRLKILWEVRKVVQKFLKMLKSK